MAPIGRDDLPLEVLRSTPVAQAVPTTPATRPAADMLFERMVNGGESFWSSVYAPFMARDLTRDDLRTVVRKGLERTSGNYKVMVELFNMPADDYKRFLGFLRKYQCHMPFQQFRSASTSRDVGRQPVTARTDGRVRLIASRIRSAPSNNPQSGRLPSSWTWPSEIARISKDCSAGRGNVRQIAASRRNPDATASSVFREGASSRDPTHPRRDASRTLRFEVGSAGKSPRPGIVQKDRRGRYRTRADPAYANTDCHAVATSSLVPAADTGITARRVQAFG